MSYYNSRPLAGRRDLAIPTYAATSRPLAGRARDRTNPVYQPLDDAVVRQHGKVAHWARYVASVEAPVINEAQAILDRLRKFYLLLMHKAITHHVLTSTQKTTTDQQSARVLAYQDPPSARPFAFLLPPGAPTSANLKRGRNNQDGKAPKQAKVGKVSAPVPITPVRPRRRSREDDDEEEIPAPKHARVEPVAESSRPVAGPSRANRSHIAPPLATSANRDEWPEAPAPSCARCRSRAEFEEDGPVTAPTPAARRRYESVGANDTDSEYAPSEAVESVSWTGEAKRAELAVGSDYSESEAEFSDLDSTISDPDDAVYEPSVSSGASDIDSSESVSSDGSDLGDDDLPALLQAASEELTPEATHELTPAPSPAPILAPVPARPLEPTLAPAEAVDAHLHFSSARQTKAPSRSVLVTIGSVVTTGCTAIMSSARAWNERRREQAQLRDRSREIDRQLREAQRQRDVAAAEQARRVAEQAAEDRAEAERRTRWTEEATEWRRGGGVGLYPLWPIPSGPEPFVPYVPYTPTPTVTPRWRPQPTLVRAAPPAQEAQSTSVAPRISTSARPSLPTQEVRRPARTASASTQQEVQPSLGISRIGALKWSRPAKPSPLRQSTLAGKAPALAFDDRSRVAHAIPLPSFPPDELDAVVPNVVVAEPAPFPAGYLSRAPAPPIAPATGGSSHEERASVPSGPGPRSTQSGPAPILSGLPFNVQGQAAGTAAGSSPASTTGPTSFPSANAETANPFGPGSQSAPRPQTSFTGPTSPFAMNMEKRAANPFGPGMKSASMPTFTGPTSISLGFFSLTEKRATHPYGPGAPAPMPQIAPAVPSATSTSLTFDLSALGSALPKSIIGGAATGVAPSPAPVSSGSAVVLPADSHVSATGSPAGPSVSPPASMVDAAEAGIPSAPTETAAIGPPLGANPPGAGEASDAGPSNPRPNPPPAVDQSLDDDDSDEDDDDPDAGAMRGAAGKRRPNAKMVAQQASLLAAITGQRSASTSGLPTGPAPSTPSRKGKEVDRTPPSQRGRRYEGEYVYDAWREADERRFPRQHALEAVEESAAPPDDSPVADSSAADETEPTSATSGTSLAEPPTPPPASIDPSDVPLPAESPEPSVLETPSIPAEPAPLAAVAPPAPEPAYPSVPADALPAGPHVSTEPTSVSDTPSDPADSTPLVEIPPAAQESYPSVPADAPSAWPHVSTEPLETPSIPADPAPLAAIPSWPLFPSVPADAPPAGPPPPTAPPGVSYLPSFPAETTPPAALPPPPAPAYPSFQAVAPAWSQYEMPPAQQPWYPTAAPWSVGFHYDTQDRPPPAEELYAQEPLYPSAPAAAPSPAEPQYPPPSAMEWEAPFVAGGYTPSNGPTSWPGFSPSEVSAAYTPAPYTPAPPHATMDLDPALIDPSLLAEDAVTEAMSSVAPAPSCSAPSLEAPIPFPGAESQDQQPALVPGQVGWTEEDIDMMFQYALEADAASEGAVQERQPGPVWVLPDEHPDILAQFADYLLANEGMIETDAASTAEQVPDALGWTQAQHDHVSDELDRMDAAMGLVSFADGTNVTAPVDQHPQAPEELAGWTEDEYALACEYALRLEADSTAEGSDQAAIAPGSDDTSAEREAVADLDRYFGGDGPVGEVHSYDFASMSAEELVEAFPGVLEQGSWDEPRARRPMPRRAKRRDPTG